MVDIEPILTVFINTYNHEKNIGRLIDSILTQKTKYIYEIVVFDDASSDGTVAILEGYREKYPDKIKLILLKENIWQTGQILYMANMEKTYINRKYVQFMDGDDYWCDNNKIQKQLEFLENNKDAIGVTHRAKTVRESEDGSELIVGYTPSKKSNNIWDINEIIDWSDAPHTSSLMFRAAYWLTIPDSFFDINATDWARLVWLCSKGNVYYMDEVMSVHVLFAKNSYTSNNFANGVYSDYDNLLNRRQNWCEILDAATEFKFHDLFILSQDRRWGEYLWEKGEYRAASLYKGFVKTKSIKKRIIMRLLAGFVGFEAIYRKAIGK